MDSYSISDRNARLDYERNSNRFMITKLPKEVTAEDISKAFTKYAEKAKVDLPTHRGDIKGYALVHIPDDSEFKALSETLGKELPVTVEAKK